MTNSHRHHHQQRQQHQMIPVAERQPSAVHDHSIYPPGYRFSPTDEELVDEYLVDYMNRQQSHDQPPVEFRPNRMLHIIPELDIYKLQYPDVIKEKFPLGGTSNKDEWYFFTPLSKKYPKGERPSRTCGISENKTGFWKPTGKDKDIKVREGVSAKRKSLEYLQGKPPGQKTDWKMHEYKLDGADDDPGHKDKKLCPALCRVYLNTRKRNKNNDDDEQEVEGGDVIQNSENDQTGSNKSPVEGEVVVDEHSSSSNATADQVVVADDHLSSSDASATADQVVAVDDHDASATANQVVADDPNHVYLVDDQLELRDYGFVDPNYHFDQGVFMDPATAPWYNVGHFQPASGNFSTMFAYDPFFDDLTPPKI